MGELTFLDKARFLVFDYIASRLEKTDTHVTFDAGEPGGQETGGDPHLG